MSTKVAVLVGCIGTLVTFQLPTPDVAQVAAGKPSEFATISTLPSFGNGSMAMAIDDAGTTIVGTAWDDSSLLHAVKWTQQSDGSWVMSDLPWPEGASSTTARAVNRQGDVAGNDFPGSRSRPLLWLAGTGAPLILGCETDPVPATVYGLSSDAQVVVGNAPGGAAVWRPDGTCREFLPPLVEGGSAGVWAVNGDGTIIGGSAGGGHPARWTKVADQWLVEQLDARLGVVHGANVSGDLVGYVMTPCGSGEVCQRGVIWYATGGSRELGTLGGANSFAGDINSTGEVVGYATTASHNEVNTAFIWSPDPAVGMLQLPFRGGRAAAANALSDVRPDGTRLVVGWFKHEAVVWVVRMP